MAWSLLLSATKDLVAPLLGCSPAWSPNLLLPGTTSAEVAVATVGGGMGDTELVGAALRHAPLLVLVVLHLYVAGAGAAEAPTTSSDGSTRGHSAEEHSAGEPAEEPCSKALGFNDTQGPKDRSFQDLQACTEHHKRTCCERNHTAKVRSAWSAFANERSQRCAKMGQLVLCSVCDADVGIGTKSSANVVSLCPSFCRRWYQACVEDFFAPGSAAELQPCGPGAMVCSPLGEITEEPSEFCERAGAPLGAVFSVASDEEEPEGCYDGVPAARSRGPGTKAPWARPSRTSSERPWWRRLLPRTWTMPKFTDQLQDNAPIIIITFVLVFVGWYVLSSRD